MFDTIDEQYMAVQIITDSTVQEHVLQSKLPVLIYFWAAWCVPCKTVSPIIEDLAKEYEGKFLVCKVNADENPQITDAYTVMSLPTIMTFKDGKPLDFLVGARGKHAYVEAMQRALSA